MHRTGVVVRITPSYSDTGVRAAVTLSSTLIKCRVRVEHCLRIKFVTCQRDIPSGVREYRYHRPGVPLHVLRSMSLMDTTIPGIIIIPAFFFFFCHHVC